MNRDRHLRSALLWAYPGRAFTIGRFGVAMEGMGFVGRPLGLAGKEEVRFVLAGLSFLENRLTVAQNGSLVRSD